MGEWPNLSVHRGSYREYDGARYRRQNLEYVAATDVQVTHDLLRMIARNLEHAENQMMLLGQKSSREYVAAFLLEMDRRLSGTGVLTLPIDPA
jgi:CRP/FNR family transcriptional regulator, nitrogen fixation regulation protein